MYSLSLLLLEVVAVVVVGGGGGVGGGRGSICKRSWCFWCFCLTVVILEEEEETLLPAIYLDTSIQSNITCNNSGSKKGTCRATVWKEEKNNKKQHQKQTNKQKQQQSATTKKNIILGCKTFCPDYYFQNNSGPQNLTFRVLFSQQLWVVNHILTINIRTILVRKTDSSDY